MKIPLSFSEESHECVFHLYDRCVLICIVYQRLYLPQFTVANMTTAPALKEQADHYGEMGCFPQ